jgi:hypothetical protein
MSLKRTLADVKRRWAEIRESPAQLAAVLPSIVEGLSWPGGSVRRASLEMLGDLGEAAVSWVGKIAAHLDGHDAHSAAVALVKIGGPAVGPVAVRLDDFSRTRTAIGILRELGPVAAPALPKLLDLAYWNNPFGEEAVGAVARISIDDRGFRRNLLRRDAETDGDMGLRICLHAYAVSPGKVLPDLLPILCTDAFERRLRATLTAEQTREELVRGLVRRLHLGGERLRRAAWEMLAPLSARDTVDDRDVAPVLAALRDHPDPAVRASLAEAEATLANAPLTAGPCGG